MGRGLATTKADACLALPLLLDRSLEGEGRRSGERLVASYNTVSRNSSSVKRGRHTLEYVSVIIYRILSRWSSIKKALSYSLLY